MIVKSKNCVILSQPLSKRCKSPSQECVWMHNILKSSDSSSLTQNVKLGKEGYKVISNFYKKKLYVWAWLPRDYLSFTLSLLSNINLICKATSYPSSRLKLDCNKWLHALVPYSESWTEEIHHCCFGGQWIQRTKCRI